MQKIHKFKDDLYSTEFNSGLKSQSPLASSQRNGQALTTWLWRVILKSGASLAGRHGPYLSEVRVNSTNLGEGWWTEFQRTCHQQFSFWLETATNTSLGKSKEDGIVCVEITEVTVTVRCPTVCISTSARQRAGRAQSPHSPIAYVPKCWLMHIPRLWCSQALADAHSKIMTFPSTGWRTFRDYDVLVLPY